MKYEIILYWSEANNAFIAEVPKLAGCMADGATAKEALHHVELIAQEWIENRYQAWTGYSRTERKTAIRLIDTSGGKQLQHGILLTLSNIRTIFKKELTIQVYLIKGDSAA